jgi:type III pantothenate kinase
MILAIDFGNSAVKAGVFNTRQLVVVKTAKTFHSKEWGALVKKHSVTRAISCSVTEESWEAEREIHRLVPHHKLSVKTKLPLKNFYRTPETLGMDRLASLLGARSFFPQKNLLVISAGTCFTFDVLTSGQQYFGGSISPGIEMRLKAMHTFTSRLPLVKKQMTRNLSGNTTTRAMLAGAVYGARLEVEGVISSYKKLYPGLRVVLTGGDAPLLQSSGLQAGHKSESKIFAVPHLVLHGLNEILRFNELQK